MFSNPSTVSKFAFKHSANTDWNPYYIELTALGEEARSRAPVLRECLGHFVD